MSDTTNQFQPFALPATFVREPESTVRIRFQDCDPFGHLNNGRYLDYFINAREEHLLECYGFDIYSERFQQRNWVVRSSTVAHLGPARNNDRVHIQTRLLRHSANALFVEGVMSKAGRLLASSWVEFAYIDLRTGRPVRHEGDLTTMFEALATDPGFRLDGGRKRVQFLKRSLAA